MAAPKGALLAADEGKEIDDDGQEHRNEENKPGGGRDQKHLTLAALYHVDGALRHGGLDDVLSFFELVVESLVQEPTKGVGVECHAEGGQIRNCAVFCIFSCSAASSVIAIGGKVCGFGFDGRGCSGVICVDAGYLIIHRNNGGGNSGCGDNIEKFAGDLHHEDEGVNDDADG